MNNCLRILFILACTLPLTGTVSCVPKKIYKQGKKQEVADFIARTDKQLEKANKARKTEMMARFDAIKKMPISKEKKLELKKKAFQEISDKWYDSAFDNPKNEAK